MVEFPWFPEIAEYAKTHPEADLGLHLTLTSERVYWRGGPVAPRDKVTSLVDENGYFHHDWAAAMRIEQKEVEVELRAQIERGYAMGIGPTHLDSHQYRLYDNGKELFEVLRADRAREEAAVFCSAGLVRGAPVSGVQRGSRRYRYRSYGDDRSECAAGKMGGFLQGGDQESSAGSYRVCYSRDIRGSGTEGGYT